MAPLILREPVIRASVTTIVWIVGIPLSFSKYNLPSYVFIANSPNSRVSVVGILPWTAVLFNFNN